MYVMNTDGKKRAVMKRRARRAAWQHVCQREGGLPEGTTARAAWEQYRLPGSRKPFKRAVELTKIIEAASKIEDRAERLLAIARLPVLRSRGHGGRHRTKQRTVFGRNMVNRSVEYKRDISYPRRAG